MVRVNCHLPIRVTVRGRLGDAHLAQLEAGIERSVAAGVAVARRQLGASGIRVARTPGPPTIDRPKGTSRLQPGGIQLAPVYALHGKHQPGPIAVSESELTSVPRRPATEESVGAPRSIAVGLIRQFTSWGNLNEDGLGQELLWRAKHNDFSLVQGVFDALGSTDRDDVALALTIQAGDGDLQGLAQTEQGRSLLDRLFDELTAGYVAESEQVQADRIIKAKSGLISIERFAADVQHARVFPYRLPGLTVLNAAPIAAERRSKGKIWVQMPVFVLGNSEFRAETATLPSEVFLSGIEISETEIVGVRMYDLGGGIIYRPALFLIQLANETERVILQKIGEAASLGLTLGAGGLVGEGVGGLARVVLWADRLVFAVGTLTSIINEHRGWIIQRWDGAGEQFIRAVEIVNSAAMLYGGTRAIVGIGGLVAGVGKALVNWRAAVKATEADLSAAERQLVQRLESSTEQVMDDARQMEAAEQGKPTPTPSKPGVERPEGGPPGGEGEPPVATAAIGARRTEQEIRELLKGQHPGHAFEMHGPQMQRADLARRILADLKMQHATRWFSEKELVNTVNDVLANNEGPIQAWLSRIRAGESVKPPNLDRVPVGRPIGEGYRRLLGMSLKKAMKMGEPIEWGVHWFEDLTAVNVQLRAGGPRGFFVLTAFPVP